MRVLNKKYWPYQTRIESDCSVESLEDWCYTNIKDRNWRNEGYYFVFKYGTDATMFALRWT